MKISVIIPSYNNLDRLKLTLASFERQTFPKEFFEICITVDGSTDGTVEFLNAYSGNLQLMHTFQLNKGQATARNRAIEMSKGEIILFTDDDCYCSSIFIEKHYRFHFESKKPIALIGKIEHIGHENYEQAKQELLQSAIHKLYKFVQTDGYFSLRDDIWTKQFNALKWMCMTCGNSSVKKTTLLASGLFDERFIGWGLEDCELGYRLSKNGVEFVYQNDLIVFHLDKAKEQFAIHSNLAKNLKHWRSKYKGNREISAFISFICRGISLENLDFIISGAHCTPHLDPIGVGKYFAPFEFFEKRSEK